MATASTTVTPRTAGPAITQGGASKVIVLNDDHNTFQGVALALARYIPGVSFERGMQMAFEIHSKGSSIVWSGTREVAELYREQLAGEGLTMAPLE